MLSIYQFIIIQSADNGCFIYFFGCVKNLFTTYVCRRFSSQFSMKIAFYRFSMYIEKCVRLFFAASFAMRVRSQLDTIFVFFFITKKKLTLKNYLLIHLIAWLRFSDDLKSCARYESYLWKFKRLLFDLIRVFCILLDYFLFTCWLSIHSGRSPSSYTVAQ